MKTPLAVSLALLGAVVAAQAQEPPTFASGVEMVQIEVRAIGKDDVPVSDLRREDFVVEEDGERQEIELFEYVAGPGPEAARVEVVEPEALPGQDPPLSQYTWLYIAPEVANPIEFRQVAGPLRRFFDDLPERFFVSLGGLPFTDNRGLLLATLDRMVNEPFGGDAEHGSVTDPLLDFHHEMTFEREVLLAVRRQDEIVPSWVGLQRDPIDVAGTETTGIDDVRGMVSVERIDRQIIFFGRLALLRYLDLIERMAAFPGKKMILLYRSGLFLETRHSDLLEQIIAASIRHRVSFFTFDSRGLEARIPVEDRRVSAVWPVAAPPPLSSYLGLPEARKAEVSGLVTLARSTGGRSVVDSNDMSAILRSVLEESSHYYVLGYAPRDSRQRGRFRELRVRASRPGVELRAPPGYYERKPFDRQSQKERSAAMYRALLSEHPSDFPVEASIGFFAGPENRTALLFSAGVRPGDLAAKEGPEPDLEASVMLRLRSRIRQSMPVLLEQELRPEVGRELLEAAAEDTTRYVAYNGRIDVSPGPYVLKVVFRDDRSGRMGSHEQLVEVPSFAGSSVPSSLLLTRQAGPRNDGSGDAKDGEESAAAPFGDPLAMGDLRLMPEPAQAVRQGHVVYCAFHLYNAGADDFEAAERGMQLGLLRGQDWVGPGEVRAGGQPFPDLENGVIRYVGWVDTEKLAPGRYTLVAVLPNYEERQMPELSGEFEVLPR
jgi:VWFA-related protein